MLKLIIFWLLFAVSISACAPLPALTLSSSTPGIETMEVPGVTPAPTRSATLTLPSLPRTPQSIPTSTPVSEIQEELMRHCIEISAALPKDVILPEILVNRLAGDLSLLNSGGQTYRIISGAVDSAGTSPDGKWLAYSMHISEGRQIMVESPDGEKSFQIREEQGWFFPGLRWLDNQRIWFPVANTGQPFVPVMVLNPFRGQKVMVKTDYPGMLRYQFGSDILGLHFGYSSVIYDPSLRLVIYPEFDGDKGFFQTLWDRTAQKAVVRVPSRGSYQNLPIWQDSLKRFLVVGYPDLGVSDEEWLAVNSDGKIQQLTHLGKVGREYVIENKAKLSPDEKMLAFLLTFEKTNRYNEERNRLILLDLKTQIAKDSCLYVEEFAWSSDGQYLAVNTPEDDNGYNRILLIDLRMNKGYQLLEDINAYPIGWLSQP